jgi:hypothetical protein
MKGNDEDPVGTVADFLMVVAKMAGFSLTRRFPPCAQGASIRTGGPLLALRSYLYFSLLDRELEDRGVKGLLVPKR